MGNPLTDAEREVIWCVMSEYFVDNEIDFRHEASRLNAFPQDTLREIFFREVAPVCGPNLMTPAPPIWTGFDERWLVHEIRGMLADRSKSHVTRIAYEIRVLYYRFRLAGLWRSIETSLR